MATEEAQGGTLRGDVFGGLTAAIIALPLALAFGVSALAPLGPEYAAAGALAGLLGAVYTGFFAALLGGTPSQVTGPTAPMTVVVTALISSLVAKYGADGAGTVLLLVGASIVVGGLTQIVLGLLGGGAIVKYMPYPVIAGFMNGIAILIVLGQLGPAVGVRSLSAFDLQTAKVPLIITAVTILAVVVTKRVAPKVPASLIGLIAGVGTYFLLAGAGMAPFSIENNPLLVGKIPSPIAHPEALTTTMPAMHLNGLSSLGLVDLKRVLTGGLTLGLLGSIDSLLTSVVADNITHSRHDSRRELLGQGAGNIISGLLGGLAGAGATVRTLVNVNAGGRTRRSGMLHAVVILVVVLALGGPAGWIPHSALAGLLFVTAVGMFDRYSLSLFRRRLVWHELAIVVLVTGVTVVVDLMVAVGIGCGVAALLFVWQQTRLPVVRRRLRCNELMSRRLRPDADVALLEAHGDRSVMYELAGAIFFGTADQLTHEVEADLGSFDRCIFDVARLREVDLTGSRTLQTLVDRLKDQEKTVYLAGVQDLARRQPKVHRVLAELGLFEQVGDTHCFESLDHALEAAEEAVLALHRDDAPRSKLPFAEFSALAALTRDELALLDSCCESRTLEEGEVLFRQGEVAESIALVEMGHLTVVGEADRRLASLGPGTMWGLRALLDESPWHSTVRVDAPSRLRIMSRSKLDGLRKDHPNVLFHLVQAGLASTLQRTELLRRELALLEDA